MALSYILDAPVALGILIITLGLSIWALLDEDFRDKHVLVPYDMLIYREYWRVLTSGFIHGNYLHMLMNMVTFYFFSFILEHRLGHWQFLTLYVLGLVLSNLYVVVRYRRDTSYEGTVGASGAISAVVLSTVICNPYLKFGLPIISEKWPILQLPGYLVAIAFMIYSLVSMFRKSEMNINHAAHLWGALAGIALTFLLKPGVTEVLSRWLGNL
ncbi:MAG: rhomboid family intramembrane serine protease [Bacteroidia bacterium]|nr:rhomboid family intramembrane serine protease [Bacteroidia bacterium]